MFFPWEFLGVLLWVLLCVMLLSDKAPARRSPTAGGAPPRRTVISPRASAGPKMAPPGLPPGATQRDVFFTNPNSERLHGVFVDAGAPPLAVLCHGYMANSESCQFPLLAARLAGAGVSSLRFDHAMALRSRSERKGPFQMGNHDAEVADMVAAVTYAKEELGKKVVLLLGHSKGGINALLYAARHCGRGGPHHVPRVVSLAGRFRVRDGMAQRFGADWAERLAAAGPAGELRRDGGFEWRLTEADARARADLDMEAAARAVRGVGFFLVHGSEDTTISVEESVECLSLLQAGAIEVVGGADHNFTRHGEEMAARVVAIATM